ncbi:MAG: cytochrome c oxidase assembly protein [Burkholderiales bacterium]|nr:MAG: cytochrome c oxidase assembly protein [Burkholderiales bacterium]
MKRAAALAAMLALLPPPAFAHGDGLPISPLEIWHHWSFDPLVCIPLLLVHWLYGRGVIRAWKQADIGRIVPVWRAACFFAGEVVLVAALIAPLDPLGETLLSAHMAQHILLTAVAPPLLVLGIPVIAWTWALPPGWRRVGTTPLARGLGALADVLSRPLLAGFVATAVMWAWHAPALFEAALVDEAIHTVEHISFFAGAVLAWRAALSPYASAVAAAGATLVAFMAGGMLGGVMCLAPAPLYDWYGNRALLWGMSPLEDQQLAGLLMWVVAGGIYLVAFAVLAFRAADPAGSGRSRPSHGIIRASTSSRSMK